MPSKFSRGQIKNSLANKFDQRTQITPTSQNSQTSKISHSEYSSKIADEPSSRLILGINFHRYNQIIFTLSFLISFFLLFNGLLFLSIGSIPTVLLYGLITTIIGTVQIIIDVGWIWLIKINRFDIIKTWKDAFNHVAKVRGSQIFIFPIIIDILVVVLSAVYLLKI